MKNWHHHIKYPSVLQCSLCLSYKSGQQLYRCQSCRMQNKGENKRITILFCVCCFTDYEHMCVHLRIKACQIVKCDVVLYNSYVCMSKWTVLNDLFNIAVYIRMIINDYIDYISHTFLPSSGDNFLMTSVW